MLRSRFPCIWSRHKFDMASRDSLLISEMKLLLTSSVCKFVRNLTPSGRLKSLLSLKSSTRSDDRFLNASSSTSLISFLARLRWVSPSRPKKSSCPILLMKLFDMSMWTRLIILVDRLSLLSWLSHNRSTWNEIRF